MNGKVQSASSYRLSNSKLDWRAVLASYVCSSPTSTPHPLCFKRRHSVKALFHGHKDGSQDSGAGPQQLQSLNQILERELPPTAEFDFISQNRGDVSLNLQLQITLMKMKSEMQRVIFMLHVNNQPINASVSFTPRL